MRRLLVAVLFVLPLCGASADSPAEVLARVTQNVAARIRQSANYTCVQTIDRSSFVNELRVRSGCGAEPHIGDRKEIMHDRLRLDVAVSEDREIYSWHGENRFVSSKISDVVGTGAISSGGFVGFLRNIFTVSGVQFQYSGKSEVNDTSILFFSYTVPLSASGYHVVAHHGMPIIPFHGSFGVNAANYQLTSLEVIADSLPNDTDMCSAETDMDYQILNISGSPALIPASFLLRIDSVEHIYSVSRNEFSACREFRGESTLLFNSSDAAQPMSIGRKLANQRLPEGLTLRIGLRTPIDDHTSYTGDRVEGVLLHPLHLPNTNTTIPKGAVLHGVITLLEFHEEPWKYYMISVQFERLDDGPDSFQLRASPITSRNTFDQLGSVYRGGLPRFIADQCARGVFAVRSPHVHLDKHFSAEWITRKVLEQTEDTDFR